MVLRLSLDFAITFFLDDAGRADEAETRAAVRGPRVGFLLCSFRGILLGFLSRRWQSFAGGSFPGMLRCAANTASGDMGRATVWKSGTRLLRHGAGSISSLDNRVRLLLIRDMLLSVL